MKNTSERPDFTPADVWRQKAIHTVTTPSGAVLRIRIPGIGTLLENGDLPDYLYGIALLDISHPDGAAGALREMVDDVLLEGEKRTVVLDQVRKLGEYQRRLVAAALVDPALTYDEIKKDDLPEDDLGMVAEIVQRLRATDARGVRIGVEPLDRWARFHLEHGLPEGSCDCCARLVAAASSVDVGAV